jgi:hypothetical protein
MPNLIFEWKITPKKDKQFFLHLCPTYYTLEIQCIFQLSLYSISGCFTDSVCFLDFLLRDIIFSGMLYLHNILLNIISGGMLGKYNIPLN